MLESVEAFENQQYVVLAGITWIRVAKGLFAVDLFVEFWDEKSGFDIGVVNVHLVASCVCQQEAIVIGLGTGAKVSV